MKKTDTKENARGQGGQGTKTDKTGLVFCLDYTTTIAQSLSTWPPGVVIQLMGEVLTKKLMMIDLVYKSDGKLGGERG